MVDLDERALDALGQHGEYLLETEFVEYVERFHDEDRDDGRDDRRDDARTDARDGGDAPGVRVETLEAYAAELEAAGPIDASELLDAVDAATTDSSTWVDDETVYRVGGDRRSRYPARWHDELGATEDVVAFVRFLRDEVAGYGPVETGASDGVPEDALLDVVATVGAPDREEAKARLEARREAGDVLEDADQHPSGNVYPSS